MTIEHSSGSEAQGRSRPLLVMLHFLGGSANTWDWMTSTLAAHFDCFAVDLSGFGDAVSAVGYDVGEMADAVAQAVRAVSPRSWSMAGHSMGAKVAAVVARRSEDGEAGLAGLSHLVLLAGSPPSPEPMDEGRRATMMGWFTGGPDERLAQAQIFIDKNVGAALPPAMNERAVADLLRMNRAAWVAWLDGGSREDWSDRIGILLTPALIVSGENDADLGPDAQARLMAPHFTLSRLVSLPGARHLLPMERAADVANLIAEHVGRNGPEPRIPPIYQALIQSDRVSQRTRNILLDRGQPDDPAYIPRAMSAAALSVLRALVDRVLPQPPELCIDLAARIDAALATGPGDGWRFALLPPDREAYDAGLRTIDKAAQDTFGQGYAVLDAAQQDHLLELVAQGGLEIAPDDEGPTGLSSKQMKLWFEDLRADAVKAYVGHPATMARIGYSGIANGGDGPRKQGFVAVGGGEREPWEPLPIVGSAT